MGNNVAAIIESGTEIELIVAGTGVDTERLAEATNAAFAIVKSICPKLATSDFGIFDWQEDEERARKLAKKRGAAAKSRRRR